MERNRHQMRAKSGTRQKFFEIKNPTKRLVLQGFLSAPTRTRTENLLIKSQLLYQLSYRGAGAGLTRRGGGR